MHRTNEQAGSAEAQAAKLRGILESAVIAIITIDDRGLIETVNPATERLFGYAAAELIGQNVKVLMPDPYRAEHDVYIRNYLKTGTRKIIGIGREVSGRRKDGGTFPIHLAVSEFEAKGRRFFTGMIHDFERPQACRDGIAGGRAPARASPEDGSRRPTYRWYRP